MYSPREALLASSLYFVFIILSFIISFFIGRILIIKSHRSVGEVQAILFLFISLCSERILDIGGGDTLCLFLTSLSF